MLNPNTYNGTATSSPNIIPELQQLSSEELEFAQFISQDGQSANVPEIGNFSSIELDIAFDGLIYGK